MKSIFALLSSDLKALRGWFKNQTFGKLFVMFGFLAVFAFITLTLYFFSSIFFAPLSLYQNYGILTSSYILHAAIIMLSFFITGASIASTLTFLLSENFQMDYLLTLPISSRVLVSWIFIRNSFVNLVFFLIVLFPIGLAFIKAFSPSDFYITLARLVIIMIMLVLATNAIGSTLGLIISRYVRKKGTLIAVLGAILFFILSYVILKLILPASLFTLYNSAPSQFYGIYNSLPLSNNFLPTFWFTQAIVKGEIYIIYSSITSLILVLGLFYFEEQQFVSIYQSLKIGTNKKFTKTKSFFKNFLSTKNPIILKDILSIQRKGSEIGYLFFLTLLGVMFFLIINYSQGLGERATKFESQFTIFVFFSFLFYATAYFLRIVFPLMAREGKAARFLFSLPIRKEKLYSQKLILSLFLSLPYFVMSILIWVFLLFGKPYFLFLSLITFSSVLTIMIINSLMGTIFPNFSEGNNAERLSTSAMGILSFLMSLVISLINAVIIYLEINGYSLSATYFFIIFIFYALAIFYLFSFFKSRSNAYKF